MAGGCRRRQPRHPRLAVRYTLQLLAELAPGNTLEVRVPPFGAVQCIEGPRHTRGTPPNVVETDAATWLALATGELPWAEALGSGRCTPPASAPTSPSSSRCCSHARPDSRRLEGAAEARGRD